MRIIRRTLCCQSSILDNDATGVWRSIVGRAAPVVLAETVLAMMLTLAKVPNVLLLPHQGSDTFGYLDAASISFAKTCATSQTSPNAPSG
jgi:hypothetical protein